MELNLIFRQLSDQNYLKKTVQNKYVQLEVTDPIKLRRNNRSNINSMIRAASQLNQNKKE